MKLNDYQSQALDYRLASADDVYVNYNLAGEVGEYLSLLAKSRRDGRRPDHDMQAKKELGDILWQLAAAAADHGFTLEDVAQSNLNKLRLRSIANTIQGSGDDR